MRRGTMAVAALTMALAGAVAEGLPMHQPHRRKLKEQFPTPLRRGPWRDPRPPMPLEQAAARRAKELQAQKRKSRQARAKR